MEKKKKYKAKHDIYISNETPEDLKKVVIKGNKLEFRWIGSSILVYSEENCDDLLTEILKEIKNRLGT